MVIQSISPVDTELRHTCQLMMCTEGQRMIFLVENCVPQDNKPLVVCFAYITFLLTGIVKKGAEFS